MSRVNLRRELLSRVAPAATILATTMLAGTAGYHWLGGGQWKWSECWYMTAITLSTVGFGELPHMGDVPWAREWTVGLIVFGSGTLVYFVSMVTAIVVEGDLKDILKRDRMQSAIEKLSDHIVVCGLGATGRHVVDELIASGAKFVVIDRDAERINEVEEHAKRDILHIIGDVQDDKVLEDAGIRRAKALVASLHDDRDNVFVVLSARALNEKLRIISKADDQSAAAKVKRAGANEVVLPALIGGMRIASQIVRPTVVQFLDEMLRERERHFRIEEVLIPASSRLVGKTLAEANLPGLADVLVMAIREANGRSTYNPPPTTVIPADAYVIVLAPMAEVARLRGAV